MSRTLVKAGTVFDGSGEPGKLADVLIRGDTIEQIEPAGAFDEVVVDRTVDASGCWVMPGFIDTHTHYDAELVCSPGLNESVKHGVTTVVIGCCSVSFILSSAEDCADLFARVEAVPRPIVSNLLGQAKVWNTVDDWKKWLDTLPLGPNVAGFIGHSDIRCRVMGLARAVDRSVKPTADEISRMTGFLNEALDAGLLGMSAMTNPWDKLDGDREWSKSLPSFYAPSYEFRALESVLRERSGIYQTAPNLVTRWNIAGILMASCGLFRKPLKTTVITMVDLKADRYSYLLTKSLAVLANSALKANFKWQAPPIPFDLFYDGLDSVLLEEFPTGQAVRHLSRRYDERINLLKSSQFRQQFRKEIKKKISPRVWHRDLADTMIVQCPDADLVGHSFSEVAEKWQVDPIDTFLDLMIRYDTDIRWHTCIGNDRKKILAKIMNFAGNLISFSDAGAHLRNIAYYNFPIRMLKTVKCSIDDGESIMSIGECVRRLTGELADWFALEAGYLREGLRADVVVLDPNQLTEEVDQFELASYPVGGIKRLSNKGSAVKNVLISGTEVYCQSQMCPVLGEKKLGRFLEAQ